MGLDRDGRVHRPGLGSAARRSPPSRGSRGTRPRACDLRRGAVNGQLPGPADWTDAVRRLMPGLYLPLLAPGSRSRCAPTTRWEQRTSACSSRPPAAPVRIRSNATVIDRVTPADTALLTSVPNRVRVLASGSPAAPRPSRRRCRDRGLPACHERYSLDSPVPDADEDAVDDFLFESHEGFCEHFASAEAVLLRAVGVPDPDGHWLRGRERKGQAGSCAEATRTPGCRSTSATDGGCGPTRPPEPPWPRTGTVPWPGCWTCCARTPCCWEPSASVPRRCR